MKKLPLEGDLVVDTLPINATSVEWTVVIPSVQHPLDTGSKSYGDVSIAAGSSAHLGDAHVSQDVVVHGDLNLHFPPALEVITATNEVVQFLDLTAQLRRLGQKLEVDDAPVAPKPSEVDIYLQDSGRPPFQPTPGLGDEVSPAFDDQGRLRIHTSKSKSSLAGSQPLDLELKHDAATANDLIQELSYLVTRLKSTSRSTSLSYHVEPEQALHHSIQTASIDAQSILNALKRVEQKSKREPKSSAAQKHLLDGIQHLWKTGSLASKQMTHEAYRNSLNIHLAHLLNLRSHAPGTQKTHYGVETRKEQDQGIQGNDIVEVLSVNQLGLLGWQTTAAVLTHRDGQTVTITPPPEPNHLSSRAAPSQLIKYDLDGRKSVDDRTHKTPPPIIEHAANFTQLILGSLYFREESARRIEVHDAHHETFHWIFQSRPAASDDHLSNWLRTSGDCYWINGKAGSGKSTLMKYIYQHASLRELLKHWAGARELLVCSFFFWHAGNHLQNSYEGILRAVLHQILTTRPNLVPTIFPRLTRHLLLRKSSEQFHISTAELKEALSSLATNMPEDLAIFLLVDGVDEYTEDHFDFARFLVWLAKCPSIKLLASSRPIPACHQIFSKVPHLRLQDLTAADIRAYIDNELVGDTLFQDMNSLEEGFAQEVIKALTEKASGVFLWIVLVVRRLLVGLGNYEDRQTLTRAIDELPNDLEDLYDFMFGKMSEGNQKEGSRYLQILSHTRGTQSTPLVAIQLYIIDKHFHGTDPLTFRVSCTYEEEQLWIKQVEGKLRSRCCGLVEVQYVSAYGLLEEPKIDFLHRTVYDYVREPSVRAKLLSLYNYAPLRMNTHLLASSTLRLRRKANFVPIATDISSILLVSWESLFADCLAYSVELSLADDENYVRYLKAADSAFSICFLDTTYLGDMSPYLAAYEVVNKKLQIPDGFVEAEKGCSAYITSLVNAARLGLSAYLRERLNEQKPNLGTKELVLLETLAVLRLSDMNFIFITPYLRNIEFLLDSGTDPDFPVQFRGFSDLSSSFEPVAAVKKHHSFPMLPPEAPASSLTPWDFCLHFLQQLNYPSMKVTLDLIKAGARLTLLSTSKQTAILDLQRRLENGQCDGDYDEETKQLIKEILQEIYKFHKPFRRSITAQKTTASSTETLDLSSAASKTIPNTLKSLTSHSSDSTGSSLRNGKRRRIV